MSVQRGGWVSLKDSAGEPLTAANPVPVKEYVSGVLVDAEKSVTFPNSAAVNTQQVFTVARPASVKKRYLLAVYNPSTVTELSVKVMTPVTLGGESRDALLTTVAVAKAQTVTGTAVNACVCLLEGLFVGGEARFVVSNGTALGAADTFTGFFRVIEAS